MGGAPAVAVVAVGYRASVTQYPELGTPWALLVGGACAAGVYYVDAAGLVRAN